MRVARSLLFLISAAGMCAAQEQGPLMKSILPRYATAKLNLIETAAAMPEADYSFKLTPPQRSFANWMEHTAEMNYGVCSSILAEPTPKDKVHAGMTAKGDLEKALKESFDYCDRAFHSMTDAKALSEIDAGSGRKVVPASSMIGLLIALNEHYGNLVGYMRSKGITPPTTARAQRMQKK